MVFKVVIILCTSGFLFQFIAGQRICSTKVSSNCGFSSIPDNGGQLTCTSTCPLVPSGLALASDLGLSGDLDVYGTVPYLSAVAFEGQFETSGTAPVSYGCGDCCAITQQIGNPSGNPYGNPGGIPAGNPGGNNVVFSPASTSSCGCRTEAAGGNGVQNRNRASAAVSAAGVEVAGCTNLPRPMTNVPTAARNTANIASVSGKTVQSCSLPARSCALRDTVVANSVVISNSGGDLPVTSVSSSVPPNIALASDVGLYGDIDICGSLPYLSAVAFEGAYDTSGSAAVSYGCGDGCIGIDNVIGGNSGFSGCSGNCRYG